MLEQADGTAWMAFYCVTMLAMALELAARRPGLRRTSPRSSSSISWHIADAMNTLGGTGLWDEAGRLLLRSDPGRRPGDPLRLRSIVGLIPLFAVEVLDDEVIARLPGFHKRMEWFLTTAATWPARSPTWRRSARTAARPSPAGHSLAAAAGAGAALRARRERVPLALRHPLALAVLQGQPLRARTATASESARATTCPASRRRTCSAAIRTGGARSGSR